jgi:hypothetical protein
MTVAIIITIFKYAGLFIAATSSIWAATNVESHEVNGSKKLTRPGKISIGLTVTGLLITIVSNILEDRLKTQEEQAAAVREIRRTNKIILAGQPLKSLALNISCSNVRKTFLQSMHDADSTWKAEIMDQQGEVSSSKGEGIARAYGSLPLFGASLRDIKSSGTEYFLMLVSLGNDAVLSYGYLPDNIKFESTEMDGQASDEKANTLPKGVFSENQILASVHYGSDIDISEPDFLGGVETASVNLGWDINPITLHTCLSKINPFVTLTASLPSTIKVIFLYDLEALPFTSVNFAMGHASLWSERSTESITIRHIYDDSILKLVPNGLEEEGVQYKLTGIYGKELVDKEYEEEILCKSLLLVYSQVQDEVESIP